MKFENNWRFKTLENLEKEVWPVVKSDSHLVIRTSPLRKIPLNEFSIEDLRIMTGQNFGLSFLIPLAIEKLKENVLAEGDMHPGDLLVAATKVNNQFWIENLNYKEELETIISENLSVISENNLKVNQVFLK